MIRLWLPLIGGLLVSAVTPLDNSWYATVRPEKAPPSWVFGPAWTVLYLMMGLAWHKNTSTTASRYFILQLALNFAWTPVFFGMRRPDIALVLLCALIVTASLATYTMSNATSTWLMVPYLAWLLYALWLNASVVKNKMLQDGT